MESKTPSSIPVSANNVCARLPLSLSIFGGVAIAGSIALAIRLIWEMTVWSWEEGPQMIGFKLMHGSGVFLLFFPYLLMIWFLIVVVMTANSHWRKKQKISGRRWTAISLGICVFVLLSLPEGFWQRMFIERFDSERSKEFLIYHAGGGDLKTVKAFLHHGVNINAQDRDGTALHVASVAGQLEVIEYLISQGADVNAINPYGDSPLGSAQEANDNSVATRELLTKHGGKLVRGTTEQRKRVIEEQVRQDMERYNKKAGISDARPCPPVESKEQPPSTRSCR